MLRWVVGSSLRFRFLAIGFAVALMVFGAGQLRGMPVDVFPEFAPPRVEVQTPCLGLAASEVESLITVPLEQALAGVPGLKVMRSSSVPQLSSIVLLFEPGTDVMLARQLVQERLTSVTPTLPTWAASSSIMPPLSSTSRVMKIGISSTDMSLLDQSLVIRRTIRPRLQQVPGVANVAVWGYKKWQYQVQVDPERLREQGVPLGDVQTITAEALDRGVLTYVPGATIGTGGFIDANNTQLSVRHVLGIHSAEDLSHVILEVRDGQPLRIGDVATVVEGYPNQIGDAVVNGGPGELLVIEKYPWANTLEVTHGVEAALDSLRPGLAGIEIDASIFRPATFIEMALHNLTLALLLGCLLVVLVLGAFLFDWRSALVSLAAIPLSLMAAGLVLYFRGATINTMVLAGLVIAVGVVVDDAIIDIENIMRRLRQNRLEGTATSTATVILEASLEVRGAIVYATLINAVAALPVFFLEGLSGAFFQPLVLSYALAVLASMVVALTITPALGLVLLRNAPIGERASPLVRGLQRVYGVALARSLRTSPVAYAALGVVGMAGVLVAPQLGQSLLPTFKERDFLMHWVTAPGTSLPEMNRIATQASKEMQGIPGVAHFGTHIGQAIFADEVVGANFAENWVSLAPTADYDQTRAALQSSVDGYPGLYRDVLTYLKERIREVLTGGSDAIVVRIFGPDLGVLRQKAEEVRQAIASTDGIAELHVELQVDEPQLEVEVDLDAAQRYGIKPGDVRRAASTIIAGLEIGDIHQNEKVIDILVWSVAPARDSLTSMREMLIDTPDGGQIRLGDIANVRVAPTPNVIKREAASRRIDVSANVLGRDLGAVASDVEQRMQSIQFPRGYHAEMLGENAERKAAQQRLLLFAVAAAVAILLLLQSAFGSFRLAAVTFLTLPTALVGGVLAAFAVGGVVSLGSLVGFFTVMGIAARNGIMLISHYQHLEREEGQQFDLQLVLRGARERLAPVLMTALATGLALVPLVVLGEIPGHEIEHPMAVVILGGLVTSTLLNLFVVPALYLRFGKRTATTAA